ncbi:MAG TPA: Crp/Fnr family transcriptional regulator, partial [Brevundimonas sp.]|nr:Crp/Fnr family transcriptional regulator [Brevundimonas sp.]
PDDHAALYPHLRRMEVAGGQILIEQDGEIVDVHFPVDAQLVNRVRFPDGPAIETALIGSEGVSGLAPFLADQPCGWEVSARMAGAVYVLSADLLRRRQRISPPLMHDLLRLSCVYQMQAVQHAACNTVHKVMPRVARWLLTAADLTAGVDIHFTQEELACALGAQRTTINDAAGQLKERKAIRYARGVIRILDRPALEQMACECYAMERSRIERAGVEA